MPAFKDEQRNIWVCTFYYTDWTGKRRRKKKEGFSKKSEATAYEREFIRKASSSPEMTFESLVQLYMEDCKSRLKPTTYENKEYLINLKVLPFFKDMPINTITPVTVRKWQNKLISDPNNYSATYLKTIHNQASAIFNFAVKYYGLKKNPAAVSGSIGKKNAEDMQFWTLEEFNTFIKAVENKPASKVIFNLLFWTGIRSGEMLALTLNDFDLEKGTVSISKNYARHQKDDLILDPKTPKSKRIINLPKFICDLVQDYSYKIYDYDPSERLFTSTKHYLYHEMVRGCKNSGVKKIRIHDLRHSHASLLIELGYSPLLIAERLGHEKVETTLQIYSHLYPNKQGELVEKLESLNNGTILVR